MGALKTYLTWRYMFIPAMFFLLFLVIAMGKIVSTEGFRQPFQEERTPFYKDRLTAPR